MATLYIYHMSFVQVNTCRHYGGKYDDLSATNPEFLYLQEWKPFFSNMDNFHLQDFVVIIEWIILRDPTLLKWIYNGILFTFKWTKIRNILSVKCKQ